jgi:hypothetical protein
MCDKNKNVTKMGMIIKRGLLYSYSMSKANLNFGNLLRSYSS